MICCDSGQITIRDVRGCPWGHVPAFICCYSSGQRASAAYPAARRMTYWILQAVMPLERCSWGTRSTGKPHLDLQPGMLPERCCRGTRSTGKPHLVLQTGMLLERVRLETRNMGSRIWICSQGCSWEQAARGCHRGTGRLDISRAVNGGDFGVICAKRKFYWAQMA